MAAVEVGAALPFYYKITHCKPWPAVEVVAVALVIKAVVETVRAHMARLIPDITAKQAQVIQPTAVVAVVEAVDIMVALEAVVTGVHTAAGRAQDRPDADQIQSGQSFSQ